MTTRTSWPRATRNRAKSGPCVAGPPTSGGQIPVRNSDPHASGGPAPRTGPVRAYHRPPDAQPAVTSAAAVGGRPRLPRLPRRRRPLPVPRGATSPTSTCSRRDGDLDRPRRRRPAGARRRCAARLLGRAAPFPSPWLVGRRAAAFAAADRPPALANGVHGARRRGEARSSYAVLALGAVLFVRGERALALASRSLVASARSRTLWAIVRLRQRPAATGRRRSSASTTSRRSGRWRSSSGSRAFARATGAAAAAGVAGIVAGAVGVDPRRGAREPARPLPRRRGALVALARVRGVSCAARRRSSLGAVASRSPPARSRSAAASSGFSNSGSARRRDGPAQYAASWSQRLIFAYIGGRVFLDNPVLGTGWYGELPPKEYARYLPDARERFPDQPPHYFPPEDGTSSRSRRTTRCCTSSASSAALLFARCSPSLTVRTAAAPAGAGREAPPSELRVPRRRLARGAARRARRRGALRRVADHRDLLADARARRARVAVPPGPSAERAGHVTAPTSLTIVHAIARLNVGGAALHVLELAAEQQRRGHDVLVVAGTLAAGEESMEYVARRARRPGAAAAGAAARALAARATRRRSARCAGSLRGARPDVLHTHTAKAGATGRIAALLAGARAARARSSTPSTATSSAATSAPRRERVFRLDRAGARPAHGRARRGERRGARRPRPLRRRAARSGSPCPLRLRPRRARRRPTRRGARPRASSASATTTFVVGWAGRLTRDQAAARPRPHAARARSTAASTRRS